MYLGSRVSLSLARKIWIAKRYMDFSRLGEIRIVTFHSNGKWAHLLCVCAHLHVLDACPGFEAIIVNSIFNGYLRQFSVFSRDNNVHFEERAVYTYTLQLIYECCKKIEPFAKQSK